MSATVLVVTWNGAHLLPSCLDAVLPEGAPVVVVDNGSTDGTVELLARDYPSVQVVPLPTNTGFAGGVHAGLQHVTTDVVVLLNNDAVVSPGWLAALLAPLEDPSVAAVTSKLRLPDGRINSVGGRLLTTGEGRDRGAREDDHGQWETADEVAFGCGGSLALRTAAVRAVGGIDPRYFLYYEDVSLCWRLWLAGWTCRYEPTSVATHAVSSTVGRGSLLQEFYLERNRLATLVLCATWQRALGAVLRYPLTTLSVFVGESRSRARRRVRPYLSLLRWLPSLLRARRRTPLQVDRRAWEQRFLEPA